MNKINISKISRPPVTEVIYDELKKRIMVDGEFTAGDKLPSETELAQMFGVSRNSVRSALQKLSNFGIIDIRVGEGSFVKELSFSNLSDFSDIIATNDAMGIYLHEFRTDIERSCTKLAILRASDEQLDILEILADKLMSAAKNDDIDAFVSVDYDFHAQLCACSNNQLYGWVYASIKNLFLNCIHENISSFNAENPSGLKTSAKNHSRLVEALKARNEKKAIGLLTLILVSPELKNNL